VRILSRYFLTNYLKCFALILIASIIAIAAIELMLNHQIIFERRGGAMGLATYFLLRIPSYYFRDLIPIACFAAVLFGIGLPARSHEITAIRAGGIAPARTVIPLLCAAAALSGITLSLNESLVVPASRAWAREMHPGGNIAFRQNSFWYYRGNALYSVQSVDREAGILLGVSVYERNPEGRLIETLQAKRVDVRDAEHWRFLDATSRTFDPRHPAKPPEVTEFAQWSRDFAADDDLSMLEASAKTLSLPKLRAYIDAQVRAGRNATRHLALYHARLSEPLTVLLFALLAAPLGFAVERHRSLAASALTGVIMLAIFYTSRSAAEMLAQREIAAAAASHWLILAAFGSYAVVQLFRVAR
jgi:LPS export ABC transporter permease LptG